MITFPPELLSRAKSIELVLTDVDGVLTDGRLYYNNQGETFTGFHILDGLGMRLLLKNHLTIGVLTGRKNPAVMHRMRELGVEHVYQGLSDKMPAYESLLSKLKLTDAEVAYLGDDIPDMPILQRVGLSACPANGNHRVKDLVHWVTKAKGGKGAFRELAELIFEAKNINVLA